MNLPDKKSDGIDTRFDGCFKVTFRFDPACFDAHQ